MGGSSERLRMKWRGGGGGLSRRVKAVVFEEIIYMIS